MGAKYDWAKIKAEYISSSISMRELATKYGIPWSTLRDRALKEQWADARTANNEKLVTRAVQKTTERIASRVARELDKEYDIADRLADVLTRALADEQQFNRHLVNTKLKSPVMDAQTVTEKIFDKVDMRAVAEAAKALQGIEDVKRRIKGIMTANEKRREKLDRERLSLERERLSTGKLADNTVFEIVDPFADKETSDDTG